MITLICKTFSCWCALPCCNKISVSHFFQTSCACKPQGWCTKMRVTAPKTSLPQIYLEAQPRQYSHAIPINRYFIPIGGIRPTRSGSGNFRTLRSTCFFFSKTATSEAGSTISSPLFYFGSLKSSFPSATTRRILYPGNE